MPANGLASATTQIDDGLQDVRWVCGPYQCWWRPGPYWAGPYWGPRPYGDPGGAGAAAGGDRIKIETTVPLTSKYEGNGRDR
jgi:hypothetical protein